MQGQPTAAQQRAMGKALAIMIMEFFSRSVEVFIRKDFGVRYFDLLGATGSGLTLFVVTMIAASQLNENMQFGNAVLGLYLLAYVVTALVHIFLAKRRKEVIHSWYSGEPLLYSWILKDIAWPRTEEHHVKLYVEPAAIFLLAIPIAILSPQLSAWLTFSSICMFTRGQRALRASRERYLDLVDAQIEADRMADAIKGIKQPYESKGVEVWGAFTPEQQQLILKQTGQGQ